METLRHPYVKSLGHRGFVQGVTISSKATNTPLCHYFGGLRYGLAPSERWRRAQKLPSNYSYGTEEQPGQCDGLSGVCPQPAFMNLVTEEAWTEDCFQCNVWAPTSEPPKGGWPVFIFIHGGFLQFGTPNTFSAAALLGETNFNAIVVMPAYRLGVFGFLSSEEIKQDATSAGETAGNHGFWDQRLALEWTKENISLFGGNPSQITISGYSAGAYSVFYQLAYDVQLPEDQAVVKQACIWSNSPTVQPKSLATAQIQFDLLLSAFDIPLSLPWSEKLSRLRAVPAKTLLTKAVGIELHEFRPFSDSAFIDPTLFKSFDNGDFGHKVAARNLRIILGECRDERTLYATWYPPSNNNIQALHERLLAEYPRHIVDTLMKLYYPNGQLPADCENWNTDAFGRVYADIQVHNMQRGLIHSLATGGAGHLLYRYRIEKRLKCVDKTLPPDWGVTHASDQYLWFWGNGEELEPEEKPMVRQAFIDPLTKFVRGDADINWGTRDHRQVRTLKPDGSVQIWQDGLWDEAMRVWKGLRTVEDPSEDTISKQ